MAYNNYNGNNRNYNGRNNSYNGRSYQNGNSRNGTPKKHSGAKSGVDKNGKPYVQGWKYDKRNGLRRFYASPYDGTKEVKSKSGKTWQNWFVRIQKADGTEIKTSGLFEVGSGRVMVESLGFVMNPKGGYKGYVGPYYFKKYGR